MLIRRITKPQFTNRKGHLGRRVRSQRGSAILEAGLAMPVLILMVCGAMDLARVFHAGILVEGAARSGVQLGSLDIGKAATDEMNEAAESDASGQGMTGLTVSSRTFCGCIDSTSEVSCTTATCSGALPGGYVETTASYTFRPLINYPGIPSEVVISRSAKFRAN